MTLRTRHSLKGNALSRQLFALAGAFVASVASVALAVPSPTPKMTAKHAAPKGQVSASTAQREQIVTRLIVKLRAPMASELAQPMSASRAQTLSAMAGVGMKPVRALAGSASLVELDVPMRLSEAKVAAARLASDPQVEYAEPDILMKKLVIPDEPLFGQRQWNMFAPSSTFTGPVSTGGTKSAQATGAINTPGAWDITTGSNGVVIAVVDTGIVNHPDLNGNPNFGAAYQPTARFLSGYDFISGNVGASGNPTLPANFVANDGDGRDPDPSDPGDWVTAQEKAMFPELCDDGDAGDTSSSWHGSHVAGIAAATTNNTLGVAGVAWNVRILPVRALGKCGGSLSDIAEAIRWAAGLQITGIPLNTTPAQVINLSLGGGDTCGPTMQSAVTAAMATGAVIVAASGNEGNNGVIAPANCTGVIAVTAHTINGENADYANVGSGVTISAPGGGSPSVLGAGGETDDPNWWGFRIWSTVLFGSTTRASATGASTGPAYAGFTGTSAASPHVAGVVALAKSILPSASPSDMRSFLTTNARAFPANSGCAPGGSLAGLCGAGLLDATLAPTIRSAPQSIAVTAGQPASFFVAAAGLGPLTYQWLRNGVPIAGATSAAYTTPINAQTDSGASFTVSVTNVVSTTVSPAATLTVAQATPTGGAPPPTGGGGGGGSLPVWQLLLLCVLAFAARTRTT